MSATPVACPTSSAALAPTSGNNVTYYGYSLAETAGAVAKVRIRDGGAVTGRILDTVHIAADGDKQKDWPFGVNARGGLYVEVVAGAIEGVILYG